MKRYLYSLVLVCISCSVFAQDFGGTPATGVIAIPRVNSTPPTPTPPPTPPIVVTTPTGNSDQVGITEGQLSVSLTGAATYSIPIAVPPGINGVVPQISLAYSSQAGNGMAGYGWNVTGVSAITRIPSTKFHDGVIDAVDFDALDRFALDGQRLIVKSGSTGIYGADGTVYETENFSNLKITSLGYHPNGAHYGPQSFVVEYPDGSVAEYGYNANSRTISDYGITYWQNALGVRISYTYENIFNTLSILKISYGTTTTTTAINEILFGYDARQRVEQGYVGGMALYNNKILKQISVVGNGTGFRNYYLQHNTTSLGYERLISITEKTGDNMLFYNPTLFKYDTTTNNTLFETQEPVTLNYQLACTLTSETVSGDFDGDGKLDIIVNPIVGIDNHLNYSLYTNINGNSATLNWFHNSGAFSAILPTTQLYGSDTTGGYKMASRQGWTIVKTDYNTNVTSFVNYMYANGIINEQNSKSYHFPKINAFTYSLDYSNSPTLNLYPINKKYLEGDFNGDGITDILAVETQSKFYGFLTNGSTVPIDYTGQSFFINLDKRVSNSNSVTLAGVVGANENSKLLVADVNGDGKSDLLVFNYFNVQVFTLNENNQLVTLFSLVNLFINIDLPILLGDYNGDGKTDFVSPVAAGYDSWNFFVSTGTDFNISNTTIGFAYNTTSIVVVPWGNVGTGINQKDSVEFSYIPSDFNGDGKTDILMQQNYTINCTGGDLFGYDYTNQYQPDKTLLILSENKGINNSSFVFNPSGYTFETAGIYMFPISVLTNHNKANLNLEYSIISGNRIITFNSTKDNKIDTLLKGITTGNGVTEIITYKPLKPENCGTNCNTVYADSGGTENYPNTDIVLAPSFKVVTQIEKQSASVYKKQQFGYYGAVSNMEGLGFMGFRATMRTNWTDDAQTNLISSVSKSNISLRGANSESFSMLGLYLPQNLTPMTAFITKAINTYNTDTITGVFENPLQTNKVFKLKNTKSEQFNGLENTSSVTTTTFDNYNNPAQSTTTLKNGTTEEQITENTVGYEPPSTTTPYVLGRPISKTNTVTIYPNTSNQDVTVTTELYQYTNHLLSQVKKKNNGAVYITEDNIFDTWGNITKKTISYPGLADRVTDYEYDTATHRFLTTSYDIEHLATVFTYNMSSGVLLTETLPSNPLFPLTTTYEYDRWFKKTKIIDYLNKEKGIDYTRNLEKTLITATGTDGSISTELFDELGRKTQTSVKDSSGNFSFQDYWYDLYDRNYKVSEPYFNFPTQWSETFYDGYGRTTQSKSFKGKIVDVVYNGLTTSVSESTSSGSPATVTLQKTKISTKNAMGNVVSMTDTTPIPSVATVDYTYFANGNLKTTTFETSVTTITQDEWGRKQSLNDPSAGLYSYTYNGFGETLTEQSPKGLTTYELDDWGKMLSKTIFGDLTNSKTTNTYYPTSKLLHTSKYEDFTISPTSITNYSYEYDDFKRLWHTTESSPQATFKRTTNFDDFGRSESEYYHAENNADSKFSDKWIRNKYLNGYHWQIRDGGLDGSSTNGTVLWQTDAVNARGQLLTAQYGNGIGTETHSYDTFGLPLKTSFRNQNAAAPFMTLTTNFDAQRGNLLRRNYSFNGTTETFDYDNLDRLTTFPDDTGTPVTQTYDDKGRILTNTVGDYRYNANKSYQNSGIKLATPAILAYYTDRTPQIITYSAFKTPVTISEYNQEKIDFEYNADGSRAVMYYGDYQADKNLRKYRKLYSSDCSMEIKRNLVTNTIEFITYIGGDGYSAPLVVKSDGTTQNYLYLHRDYQGTILAITDEAGVVLEKRAFDAWGSLIKLANSSGITAVPTTEGILLLDRGYTGHEHLLGVGLINMNARLYDPKLHRFLSPDNFVQDPLNSQSFNRYGYCWNNPLKYTDTNGELHINWNDIIAGVAIVVGVVLCFTPMAGVGGALIGTGLAHFGAAYAEYTKTGNWNAASNNAGISFSTTQDTGWGDSDSNNGVSEAVNGDYVTVPTPETPKNEANNVVRIPCIVCHHNTEANSFDFFNYESSSNFGTGANNTLFGTVGAFSSAAYMIETGGIGAALGGSTAFTLSLSQFGLGFNQMNESFSSNPDSSIYTVSNVVGYGALTHHSQYTQLLNSGAGLLSGSMSGGNVRGIIRSCYDFQQGKYITYNGLIIYNNVNSYIQVGNTFYQPYKGK